MIRWCAFMNPIRFSNLMYGNPSAEVVVGGVSLSGSFYMRPTVQCILCSENVYTAHYMKQ